MNFVESSGKVTIVASDKLKRTEVWGETDPAVLVAAMAREIGATPLARPDYVAVVDDGTFTPIERVGPGARAIVAARFPSARLIDNLALPAPVSG